MILLYGIQWRRRPYDMHSRVEFKKKTEPENVKGLDVYQYKRLIQYFWSLCEQCVFTFYTFVTFYILAISPQYKNPLIQHHWAQMYKNGKWNGKSCHVVVTYRRSIRHSVESTIRIHVPKVAHNQVLMSLRSLHRWLGSDSILPQPHPYVMSSYNRSRVMDYVARRALWL